MNTNKKIKRIIAGATCLSLLMPACAGLTNLDFTSKVYAETTSVQLDKYTFNGEKLINTDTNRSNIGFQIVPHKSEDETKWSLTEDGNGGIILKHSAPTEGADGKTYTKLYTTDKFVTFEQGYAYKVIIKATTLDLNGKAYISLFNATDEDDKQTITVSSNYSDKEYIFYTLASPLEDINYKLSIELGSADESASGSITLKSVEVNKIAYSLYDSASTTSSVAKFKLYTDKTTSSSNVYYLNNGSFNTFEIKDADNIYPATPTNWTIYKGTSDTQVSGVVNTSNSRFSSMLSDAKITIANPYDTETNNNVLMLYNGTADTISAISKEQSLSANSYYIFDTNCIKNYNADTKISLITKVDGKEVELVYIDANDDTKLYLHTGSDAISVSMKITMTTTSGGYSFFDDFTMNYAMDSKLAKSNYNQFALDNPNSTAVADLGNLLYTIGESGYPPLFSSNDTDLTISSVNITDLDDTSKGLLISANNDVNTSIKSKLGYKMSANKYYKFDIDIKTNNIVDGKGANISLTGFDTRFNNVNTGDVWKHYSLYLTSDTAITSYLELGLGNDDSSIQGDVYLANAKLTELKDFTVTDFTRLDESETLKKYKAIEEDEEEDDEQESTTDNKKKYTWIIYLSAIAFPVVLVGVLVAMILRKIKIKNPIKKKRSSSYDRAHTLNMQAGSREASKIREKMLLELKNKIKNLETEKSKQENQYKLDMRTLRDMKKKSADKKKINKFEKKMKSTQKLANLIGKTIAKLNKKINKITSDIYMQKLTFKVNNQMIKEAKKQTKNTNKPTKANKVGSKNDKEVTLETEENNSNTNIDGSDKELETTNERESNTNEILENTYETLDENNSVNTNESTLDQESSTESNFVSQDSIEEDAATDTDNNEDTTSEVSESTDASVVNAEDNNLTNKDEK